MWPKYRKFPTRTISFSQLFLLVADKRSLRAIGIVILLIGFYILGIHFTLPFADVSQVRQVIARSPLLAAFSAFLTGKALENLGPFTLGLTPLILLYSGSITVRGGSLRFQARIKLWSFLGILIISGLGTLWLRSIAAIPSSITAFSLTMAYLTAGLLVLFWLDSKMAAYNGPAILNLNATLIAITYIQTIIATRKSGDIIAVLCIILFAISFIFLAIRVEIVQMFNIRSKPPREGILPIPVTSRIVRLVFLAAVLVISFVLMSLVNFFLSTSFQPFGRSLPEIVLVILAHGIVTIGLLSNEFIDDILGQFNSNATARRLRNNYWIIPNVDVDMPTAYFLKQWMGRVHRINYIFYFGWIIIFSLLEYGTSVLKLPITPLPFGPFGFLVIMTLCSELGYYIIKALLGNLERVNFKELLTPLRATDMVFEQGLESYDIYDILNRILGSIPIEERIRLLQPFATSHASYKDVLAIVLALRNNPSASVAEGRVDQIVYKLLRAIIYSILLIAATLWLLQTFAGQAFDASVKANLILFAIPLFVGFVLSEGLDKDIKALLRRIGKAVIERVRHRQGLE
jgi:hypothetical protein